MAKSPNRTTAPTGQIAPFGLRLLPEQREKIEEAARVSGRSMNAEIVARLAQSFELSENASSAEMLLEMRRTQLHLELNTISSQMGYLFARGQEVRAAITRLENEKAPPDAIDAAKKALASIPHEKKILDVRQASALGRLAELELRIKEGQEQLTGTKPSKK